MLHACRLCVKRQTRRWLIAQTTSESLSSTSSPRNRSGLLQQQQIRRLAATPVDLPSPTKAHLAQPVTPLVEEADDPQNVPRNEVGVQLLPRRLHKQLFPASMEAVPPIDPQALSISRSHLSQNGLKASDAATLPQTAFNLPPLQGKDLGEHFWNIGRQVAQPWLGMAHDFATHTLTQPPEERQPETNDVNGGDNDFRVGASDWLQFDGELRTSAHLRPVNWSEEPGWTKYPVLRSTDGEASALGPGVSVPYPDKEDDSLVFDVETMVQAGPFPVMATAVGRNAWYSWLSPWLLQRGEGHERQDHLIPLGPSDLSSAPRLVIGHNVSYDRARTAEEYTLDLGSTRWLDTMSLHVATRGISSPQRPAWMKHNKSKAEKRAQKLLQDKQLAEETLRAVENALAGLDFDLEQLQGLNLEGLAMDHSETFLNDDGNADFVAPWMSDTTEVRDDGVKSGLPVFPESKWLEETSKNSLADVARLHRVPLKISKESRDAFVEASSRQDILADVQHLLSYCASDVEATHAIFCRTWTDFVSRCPHPATMAGVFGLGSTFLPVDDEWNDYRARCDEMFNRINDEVQQHLVRLAEKLKVDGCKNLTWSQAAHIAQERAQMIDENNTEPVFPDAERTRVWWEDDPWFSQLDWSPKKPRRSADGRPLSDHAVPSWYRESVVRNKTKSGFSPKSVVAQQLLRLQLDGRPILRSAVRGWMLDDETRLTKSSLLAASFLKTYGDRLTSNAGEAGVALLDAVLGKEKLGESELAAMCRKLAEDARDLSSDEVEADVQLRQLDWTAKELKAEELLALEGSAAVDAKMKQELETQVAEPPWWPKWYWELFKSANSDLNVTIRSAIAPILLKISWLGCPLYRSREHKWVFRHDPIPGSTLVTRQQPLSFSLAADGLMQHLASPVKQPPAKSKAKGGAGKGNAASMVKAFGNSTFYKVPHSEGDGANVGSPFGKNFIPYFEDGTLQSQHPDEVGRAAAKTALDLNVQCSYWIAVRDRVNKQMVIWDGEASTKMKYPSGASGASPNDAGEAERRKGMILPQVISMGTVTRRAIENTWLTASNAKKNRVGSELKSMVKAPPGYSLVGADVDSEELWICSVMGDAQFGVHGATAVGWMTLEGTKALGTDLHSKTASILGTSRNQAKVFNYSRIYGAGIKHATHLLLKANPSVSTEEATHLSKDLYRATKGQSTPSDTLFGRKFWFGGTESYVFNKLESIALSDLPQTPALDCGVTNALTKKFLSKVDFGNGRMAEEYMPSRINWVVQSSGVDYLHLLITAMEWLTQRYDINARFMLSVHDEVRYLVKDEDRYRAALALQIANIWTRALFAFKLQMDDLPLGCAFFSQVDIDKVLRKEADDPCITPSHPNPIPAGIALTIEQILEKTQGLLTKDGHEQPDARARTVSVARCDPSFPPYTPSLQTHRSMGQRGLYYLQAQASTELAEIRALEARATHAENGGTDAKPTSHSDEEILLSSYAEQAVQDRVRRKFSTRVRAANTDNKRPTSPVRKEAGISTAQRWLSTRAAPASSPLANFFPRKKPAQPLLHQQASHRSRVRWQVYRPLLRECGTQWPELRANIRHVVRFKKSLVSQVVANALVAQAESLIAKFRSANTGDKAAQAWLAHAENYLAVKRNRLHWNLYWTRKLQEARRPPRKPRLSGALLPPSLYNRPALRVKPVQPIRLSMMIVKRRKRRLIREQRLVELKEMLHSVQSEERLMSHFRLDARGFESYLQSQIRTIEITFDRDAERSKMVFSHSMLRRAKEAKRSRAREREAYKHREKVAARQNREATGSTRPRPKQKKRTMSLADKFVRLVSR